MFDFFKNKAVNFIADDLDECIEYISNKRVVPDSENQIAQIISTIVHFSTEIAQGRVSVQQVSDHFKNLKNKALHEKSLKNCRDPDFASSYILMCFFIFLAIKDQSNARLGMSKILSMCEAGVPSEIRSSVLYFTQPLRRDFKI